MNRLPVELAAVEPTRDTPRHWGPSGQGQALPPRPDGEASSPAGQLPGEQPVRACSLRSSDAGGGDETAYCRCRDLGDVRVVRSDELLQGQRELRIIHGQDVYRLFCTRNNKLILQK